ncbi:MAG: hypothetical protein J6X56_06205, partial [Ruminococcus sp.]|nr:hypothetical protein [Ruminococcus sp.]
DNNYYYFNYNNCCNYLFFSYGCNSFLYFICNSRFTSHFNINCGCFYFDCSNHGNDLISRHVSNFRADYHCDHDRFLHNDHNCRSI